MRNNRRRSGDFRARPRCLACWLVIVALLGASGLAASHYRGASATHEIDDSGVVTLTCYSIWRSAQIDVPAFQIRTGSGGGGSLVGNMTLSSTTNPFSTGTEFGGSAYTVRLDIFTYDLSAQAAGTYYAWWTDTARVASINNAPASDWSLQNAIVFNGTGAGTGTSGPTLSPATIDIVGRGAAYAQYLNTQDPDGDPVQNTTLVGATSPDYGPTSEIAGLILDPANGGRISIASANTSSLALGRWVYKVRSTDASGATAEKDVLIVVQELNASGSTNNAPEMSSIGPKTVAVTNTLSFSVTGTDADSGETITLRAQGLPSGATFSTATAVSPATVSSTFSWTPGAGTEGTYYVFFELFDDDDTVLIDSELVAITVTGSNTPPVLASIGNKTTSNNALITFTISGSDVDGDNLTYSAFFLPSGATFTPATGVFSWTPAPGQNNTVHTGIVFRVTDDGSPNLYDEEVITIVVGNGNNPPVMTGLADVTITLGDTVSFTVTGTDLDTGDNLILTVGLGGLPSGATYPGNSGTTGITSAFSWTPGATGVTTVNFRIEDDGSPALFDEVAINITVADADSSISENSVTASITSTGGYQTVWVVTVTDAGTADGLPTIIDEIIFSFTSGTFDATNFNWRRDGSTTADASTATTITFNNGGGGSLLTVADGGTGTITLEADPQVSNSASLDGWTMDIDLATANITTATGSSAFQSSTLDNSTDTAVTVTYDRLALKSSVTDPETTGNPFDMTVWFTDANGNLDTGVTGDTVTVARDDSNATTGQIKVGAGAYAATASGTAASGIVAFTAAGSGQITLGANGSPTPASRTLQFTSASITTGGNDGHSGTPLTSNTFQLDTLAELSVAAGPTAESAEVTSDSNGAQTMALDFNLVDAGADDAPSYVTDITVDASGSTATLSDGVWRLTNGTSGSDLGASITGTVVGTDIVFDIDGAGELITVADGTSEDYRITFEPNAATHTTTEGQLWVLAMTNASLTAQNVGSTPDAGGSINNTGTSTGGMALDVNATEMRFELGGLPNSPPISGAVNTALTAGNTFLIGFYDQYGNFDSDAGDFDANTIEIQWNGGGAITAGATVDVASGQGEFVGLTIDEPGLIVGTITVVDNGVLHDDGATAVGAANITRTFDLLDTVDEDATIATGATNVASITSVGGDQNAWSISISDNGLSDQVATVVTGATVTVSIANGGTNTLNDFTWRLNGDAATGVNTGTGEITFTLGANVSTADSSVLSSQDGAGVVTNGSVNTTTTADGLTLSIEPAASVTDPANLDGLTFTISVTAMATDVGSSLFTGLPLAKGTDVVVGVTYDRLALQSNVPDPATAGAVNAFDMTVWFVDANGNLDASVNGDSVTVARDDSNASTGQIQVGAGGFGATATGTATAGIVAFTAAGNGQISFGANASPTPNSRTLEFTSASITTGGNAGHSGTPLTSNTFQIDTMSEVTVSTGATAESAELSSVSNGSQTMALDFNIVDGGQDANPAYVTFITVDASASTATLSDGTWRLTNGTGGSDLGASVTGTVNGTDLEFDLAGAGEQITIADGGSEDYRVTFEPTAATHTTTEGQLWILTLNDTGLTCTNTGSTAAGTSSVDNTGTVNGGMEYDVDATTMAISIAGLPNSPALQAISYTAMTAGNNFLIEFFDALGNRDTDAGDNDANTIEVQWSGAATISAGATVDVSGGSGEFTGLTFTDPGEIGGTLTFIDNGVLQEDGATPVGAGNLTRTFDVRDDNDANSTIANGGTDATTITSVGGNQNIWSISVTDLGTSDKLDTVINGLTLSVTPAANGSNTLDDFTWSLNGENATSVNTTTNVITFNLATAVTVTDDSVLTTQDGSGNETAGSVVSNTDADVLVISIAPNGAATDTNNFDGMQLESLSVTALSYPGGGTTVTGLPLNKANNIEVVVTATAINLMTQPGDALGPGLGIAGKEFINVGFDIDVEYVDVWGNRDKSVAGDTLSVVRSDAGTVTQGTSEAAVNGVAQFRNANLVDLHLPEDKTGTLFLTVTDGAGGSVNLSGSPVDTNTFELGEISRIDTLDPLAGSHDDDGSSVIASVDIPVRITSVDSTTYKIRRFAGPSDLTAGTYSVPAAGNPAGGGLDMTYTMSETIRAGELIEATATTGIFNNITTLALEKAWTWRFRQKAGAAAAYFNAVRRPFGTGTDATMAILLADMDGDGHLDTVSGVLSGQNTINLGDGGGGVVPASTINFGTGTDATRALVAFDVDDDGDLDLVAGNNSEVDRLYLNDGAGNMTYSADISASTLDTRSVEAGDIDMDGDLDLAVGVLGGQNTIYLNDGAGNLTAGTINFGTGTDATKDVLFADMDNDGSLDMLVFNNGTNQIILNDGAGALTGGTTGFGGALDTRAGDVGDVDGDGNLDIVTSDYGSGNHVYIGDGAGGISSNALFNAGAQGRGIVLLDADGDGDLDVAVAQSGEESTLWLNDGTGNYVTSRNLGTASGDSTCIVVGEIQEDGDVDLAIAVNGGQDQTHLNTVGIVSTSPDSEEIGVSATSNVSATASQAVTSGVNSSGFKAFSSLRGQLSGAYSGSGTTTLTFDPTLDLSPGEEVMVSLTPTMQTATPESIAPHVFRFRGETTSGEMRYSAKEKTAATGGDTVAIIAGDFDNDGDFDSLSVVNGQSLINFNDGTGQMIASSVNIGGASDPAVCGAVGDLDSDGDLDLILLNNGAQDVVYFNGGGTFSTTGTIGGAATTASTLLLFDVDGDGDLDAVVGVNGGQNIVYFNNGAGVFSTSENFGTGTDATASMESADLDSDGDMDLLVGNDGGQDVLYMNDGTGTFIANQNIGGAADATSDVAIEDIDGDGSADLITAVMGGDVRVTFNSGGGNFSGAATVTVASSVNVTHIEVLDGDGDGNLDVALALNGSQNRIYQNQGGQAGFTLANSFGALSGSTVWLSRADVDGDGDEDLLEANASGEDDMVRFNQPVEVDSHTPTTSEENVSRATDVSVVFNSNMQAATDSNITIHAGYKGKLISGSTATYPSASSLTQVVDPTADFSPGEVVEVTVSDNYANLNGTMVAVPAVWRFRAAASSAPALFNARSKSVDAGPFSESIALGDLDGDGDLDMVIAVYNGQNLVYLSEGDGFSPTIVNFGSGSDATHDVMLSDLDGDGDLDIATVNNGASNQVYLNDGSGNFTAGDTFGNAGANTYGVAAGDLDGDGDLDLVSVNAGAQNTVSLNDGSANFTDTTSFGAASDQSHTLIIEDMDRDDDLDVVVGNQLGQNVIYLNEGSGALSDGSVNFGTGTDITRDLAAGDFDSDGDTDLAVANEGEQSLVYLNDGSLGFGTNATFGGATDRSLGVAVGDLDGDGDLDLAVARTSQQAAAFINDGSADFSDTRSFGVSSSTYHEVAVGDIDGDGDLDVALASRGGRDAVFFNAASVSGVSPGRFANLASTNASATATLNINSASVANNATFTLHAANTGMRGVGSYGDSYGGGSGSSTLSLTPGALPTLGDAYFAGEVVEATLTSSNVTANGDSFTPNAWRFRTATASGNGNYGASRTIGGAATNSNAIKAGDVDLDGDLDAVVAYSSGVLVFTSDGAGTFTNSGQSLGGSGINDIALADFDGDGDLDLVIARTGSNLVYLNNGSGSFSNSGQSLGGAASIDVECGDLDGDGDWDLAIGNNGASALWLNDGSANFTDSGASVGTANTAAIQLADVDGDGDLDIIEALNGANRIWLRSESGTYYDSGQSLGSDNSTCVAAADIDGDNDVDLIFGNNGAANKVYRNNGRGIFSDSGQSLGSANTVALALGDLDADGDLDLIEGTGSGDAIYAWEASGSGSFTNNFVNFASSANTGGLALADWLGTGRLHLAATEVGGQDRIYLNGIDEDALVSAGTLSEPTSIDSITSASTTTQVYDFLLTDQGTADNLPTSVSQVAISISGTADASEHSWFLSGPDISGSVAGSVSGTAGAQTLTFSGLTLVVANGSSETYVVSLRLGATPANTTDNQTFVLSIDDTGFTTDASRTQFVQGQTAVTNGTGLVYSVTATKLVITTQPGNGTAGSTLSTQPAFSATDAAGNVDTDYATAVSAAISTDPSAGSASLAGTSTTSPTAGSGGFSDLRIDYAEVGYRLTLSSGTLPDVETSLFDVVAGPASILVPMTQPSASYSANTPITISARVEDAFGNILTSDSGRSVALSVGPGSPTTAGTFTTTTSNGVATFVGVRVRTAGTGYQFTYASAGLTSGTSSAFDITPGAAAKLNVSVQPATSNLAGAGLSIQVEVLDQWDNRVTSDNGRTINASTTGGNPPLFGTTSASTSSGVASFTDTNVRKVGTNYSIRFADNSLTADSTDNFAVTPAAVSQMAMNLQPSSQYSAGATISVSVKMLDPYGNLVTGDSGRSVSVTMAPSPTLLGGTATQSTTSGIASFGDLSVSQQGTGFGLSFSSAGLSDVSSSSFDIVPGTPTSLNFVVQPPSSVVAGASISYQIEVLDQFNNRVTSDNGRSLTASLDGAVTLKGQNASGTANGIALFTSSRVEKIGSAYQIRVTSGTLTDALSDPFDVTPATASKLAFTVQPSSSYGAGDTINVTASVQDKYGNLVSSDSGRDVTIAIANNGALVGTATLSGTLTQQTSSGSAQFNDLFITSAGTAYTLRVSSSPALIEGTSTNFDIGPGPLADVVFEDQPADGTAGDVFTASTRLTDQYGNTRSDSGIDVSISLGNDASRLSNAVLQGASTEASVNGVSTFSTLRLDQSGEGFTLIATIASGSAAGANGESEGFDVDPDTAVALVLDTQPPSQVVAGETFNAIPQLVDQYGNWRSDDSVGLLARLESDGAINAPGTLYGQRFKSSFEGRADFNSLWIEKAGSNYTIKFTAQLSGGLDVISVPIEVLPAQTNSIAITQEPADQILAGTAFNTVGTLRDTFGNDTNQDGVLITATLQTKPIGATLTGTTTLSTINGQVDLNDLILTKAGTYTLLLDSSVTPSTESESFEVLADDAIEVRIVRDAPAIVVAGGALGVETELVDVYGNRIDTSSPIVATILVDGADNPPASLTGTSSLVPSSGFARFDSLGINRVGSGFQLEFSIPALPTVTSDTTRNITVVHNVPAALAMVQQPGGARGGEEFDQQPVVAVVDAYGNVCTRDSSTEVDVFIFIDPTQGAASLSGLTGVDPLTVNRGIASFFSLKIDRAARNYALGFSASGLISTPSNFFDVVAGAPATIEIVTQPEGDRAPSILTQQPVVQLFDLGGNTPSSDRFVRAEIATDPNGRAELTSFESLNPLESETTVGGTFVTFTDLEISHPGSGFVLRFLFDDDDSAAVLSDPFDLEAGTQLISTQIDDHDNNGRVTAGDDLYLQFSDVLNPDTIPTSNQQAQLDRAMRLTAGTTFGADAIASFEPSIQAVVVRLGRRHTLIPGQTLLDPNPVILKDFNGNGIIADGLLVVGEASSDIFSPDVVSIRFSENPAGEGVVLINVTYSDLLMTPPTLEIARPNGISTLVGAMSGTGRYWSYFYSILPTAEGMSNDGIHTITALGDADIWGNAFDTSNSEAMLLVDVNPPLAGEDGLEIIGAMDCVGPGDVLAFRASFLEPGLTVSLDLSALDSDLSMPLLMQDQGDGTYIATTPALSANTTSGQHVVSAMGSDGSGNFATLSTVVNVDATPPTVWLDYHAPGNQVQAGQSIRISITYNELVFTQPFISITGLGADVVNEGLMGTLPRSSFTYFYVPPLGSTGAGTVTLAGGEDCAGNLAAAPTNNQFTVVPTVVALRAEAGDDLEVSAPTTVTLDGSASMGAASYLWEQLAGPRISMSDRFGMTNSLTINQPGEYVFRLTVEGGGNAASDHIRIVAPDESPRVDAGDDLYFQSDDLRYAGSEIYTPLGLRGKVLGQAGRELLDVRWIAHQDNAGNLSLVNPYALHTPIRVDGTRMIPGVYRFTLQVHDLGTIASGVPASDEIRVVVNDDSSIAPWSDSGVTLVGQVGESTALIAPASGDFLNADEEVFSGLSYQWQLVSQPSGSVTSVVNATNVTAHLIPDRAGLFEVELVVTDSEGQVSGRALRYVLANDPELGKYVPITLAELLHQDAGFDEGVIQPGEIVTLSAAPTLESDLRPLSFTWRQLAGPQRVEFNSLAVVQEINSPKAPLAPGNYKFSVTARTEDGIAGKPAELEFAVVPHGLRLPDLSVSIDPTDDPEGDGRITIVGGGVQTLSVNTLANNRTIDLRANLNGSFSDIRWTQLSGPAAILYLPDSASLRVEPLRSGVYLFQVTATDLLGIEKSSRISVTVEADVLAPLRANFVPNVSASTPIKTKNGELRARVGNTVYLNASVSDIDSVNHTLEWEQTSGPAANLTQNSSGQFIWEPKLEGIYTFRAYANDGIDRSPASNELTIRVLEHRDRGRGGICGLQVGQNGPWLYPLLALLLALFASWFWRRARLGRE